jgi:energy-coupling factor transporter ATP-binding protein EcfA2
MQLKDLPSPFRKQQVGDERTVPAGNVPDLHKSALGALRAAAQDVRGSDDGTSLLVVGETGSGKTHLITQLRAGLANDPTAVVVRVPLTNTYAAQVWRASRARLVTELLQRGWHPNEPELTGLYRLIKNRFPKWGGGIFGGVFNSVSSELTQLLNQFAAEQEFSYDLRHVLPKLWDKDTATVTAATDWLRGKRLGEDDRKSLGLPPAEPSDYEQEQTAREVVLSLLRLAGRTTTLLLCFDELEAILTGTADDVALRAFATLVADLIAEPGAKVLVTFVRPATAELLKRTVEKSNLDKMSQSQARLAPLDRWEQVVQVVCARLQSEPLLKAERAKRTGQFWPLGDAYLRKLLADNPNTLTPRHLLRACAVEYDRLRKGAVVLPPADAASGQHGQHVPLVPVAPAQASPPVAPPPAPPPPPPDDRLAKLWAHRRKFHREHLQALNPDTLFGIGLPWLAAATAAPLAPTGVMDPKLPDVSVILRPTAADGKPVGVALCHQDPRTLWRRLDKLMNQAQAAKAHGLLGRLVLIRPKSAAATAAAQERFDKLARGGAVVLFPTDDQLADLAAFQELLTKANTGDLTDEGKPLPAADYCAWAAVNLTPDVCRLAGEVFGTTAGEKGVLPPPPPAASPAKSAPKKLAPALFA